MIRILAILLLGLMPLLAAEQARPGRTFTFPRDHGSHPTFRTEWWYITGHLFTKDSQRLGFQITFFRQAPEADGEHLYLAHCALLDATTGRYLHEERLHREGWDAFASTESLDLRNGNWTLKMTGETIHANTTILQDALLQLALTPAKPLVFFGKDGVSKKGLSEQAASHYLTFPRLNVTGTVKLGEDEQQVTGQAWMDHEFSSSQLDEGQVGWDWASIQLNDGSEVMVYRMRRADGSSDPHGTTLAWIDAQGSVRHIGADAFTWTAGPTWASTKSKAQYPIRPIIRAEGRTFRLEPLADTQEIYGQVTGLSYWEGACNVYDEKDQLIGSAFLELAGYTDDLGRHLRVR
jgi:predicted secreted hydrolase